MRPLAEFCPLPNPAGSRPVPHAPAPTETPRLSPASRSHVAPGPPTPTGRVAQPLATHKIAALPRCHATPVLPLGVKILKLVRPVLDAFQAGTFDLPFFVQIAICRVRRRDGSQKPHLSRRVTNGHPQSQKPGHPSGSILRGILGPACPWPLQCDLAGLHFPGARVFDGKAESCVAHRLIVLDSNGIG